MDTIEYDRERRRQRAYERLGTNDPKCLFCPEDDPSCLERHHLSGRAFGDDCIVVCRNCHRKLSDRQKGHDAATTNAPTVLEQIGHLILGIADGLELLKVPGQLVTLLRQSALHLISGSSPGVCGGEVQK